MKQALIAILLNFTSVSLFSQVPLIIEGRDFNDTETGISNGYSVPRSQPTALIFRNNSLTSVNEAGYMLQAGDEVPGYFNNNLDGAVISGNKFTWNGTNETSTTHALFTGYNVDVIIKYNYLNNTPNGIQRKSDGMTDRLGVIAYNIIKNPKVGIVVKGMNSVRIYSNTLYTDNTTTQASRGLIDIQTNYDGGLNAASTGTKVFNNIFYAKGRTLNIKIFENACLSGFESDYNIFWCEEGEPVFEISGETKTFTQWQALGYDLHSSVINPDFKDLTDFVPRLRLDYGKDLGPDFLSGLATDAVWNKTEPKTTIQNGTWQVGARIAKSSDEEVRIYFNADVHQLFVEIADIELPYQTIKIHDFTGKIVLIKPVEHNVTIIPIPESFTTGIYIIVLESGSLDSYRKKVFIVG